jgi:hypothetical protein
VACSACLGVASFSTPAGADTSSTPVAEPFRLVWSSSAECGDATTFLSELARRTALLREAKAGEHAITLIVETFPASAGVRGQLTVRKPDGDLTVREVPGSNCREVEAAMALIAALMVDPLAGSPERASVDPAPEPLPVKTTAHREHDAWPWSLRAEHRLTGRTAVAPRLAWGQAVRLMLTRETSSLRPSLGVAAHSSEATTEGDGGAAEFRWASAELAACPVGARPGSRWDLRACGTFQLGRLRGTGFLTAAPAARTITWSSAGLELQARYQLLGPLWLGWEGAFTFPFSRERFYLEPNETLHRVPVWAGSFGIGLGLRFF